MLIRGASEASPSYVPEEACTVCILYNVGWYRYCSAQLLYQLRCKYLYIYYIYIFVRKLQNLHTLNVRRCFEKYGNGELTLEWLKVSSLQQKMVQFIGVRFFFFFWLLPSYSTITWHILSLNLFDR